MRLLRSVSALALGSSLLLLAATGHADPGTPGPLRILLTNDDGFDSIGITTLQAALLAAGHDVTVVAPLDQQSGKGGALDTGVGSFVDVILESAPGDPPVWSVDSTPSDAVRAALGAVMAGNPPELIVSGSNFGQNLARPGTNGSGTIGAALQGVFNDIPAIAVSVGLAFSEAGSGFPSTIAAFAPTADFVVALIEELQTTSTDGRVLPERHMLNVNVPVPFGDIEGVRLTRLAQRGDFEFVWQDVLNVIPSGGGGILINIGFPAGPDPIRNNDTDAFVAKFISITPLDGDMTAASKQFNPLRQRLKDLTP